MAAVAPSLPQWDMSVVFPDLQSSQFEEGYRAATAAIDDLAALFDRLGIGVADRAPTAEEATRSFDEVVPRLDQVLRQARTLYAYINAFVATDSRDARAQAALSRLQPRVVLMAQLGTRFSAWIGSLDVDSLIAASPLAAAHTYMLQLAREEAGHLMSPAEEALAAELISQRRRRLEPPASGSHVADSGTGGGAGRRAADERRPQPGLRSGSPGTPPRL